MIINETMARKVFGTEDPIGRKIRSWRDENVLREIVGVVSDVRYTGLASTETSLVYVPHRQDAWGLMIVSVRAKGRPAGLAATLREETRKLDPDVAVAGIATLESSRPSRLRRNVSARCCWRCSRQRRCCSPVSAFTA